MTSSSNHITRVAVVGAGGNCGRLITEALLNGGKHSVTAITRLDSPSKLPDGVASCKVSTLQGQDALVLTLKLINAAGKAGVPWILPSEFAPDTANEALVNDVFVFQPKLAIRKAIEDLGKSSFIAVSTGFWYEYTLAMAASFGIDFSNRSATLFDDGETKISVSTIPQVGRAVASLLSLPIRSEGSGPEACLDNFKNKLIYIDSFTSARKTCWNLLIE